MIATAQSADVAKIAAEQAAVLAEFFQKTPGSIKHVVDEPVEPIGIVEWGEKWFYIPVDDPRSVQKGTRIRFLPHQKVILELFFGDKAAAYFGCVPSFQTLVFSTVKKSGKTALAALVARWITETWGSHAEVYSLANDLEQARGRIYAAALASIELDPRYARAVKGIRDQWRIIEREARYLPTNSTLRAVSSDYKGEAGSNPVATLWSELWGYSSEASLRLWEELTPVPTRPRSIRYIETYAGYEGESGILNELEDKLKSKASYRVTQADLKAIGLEWPWPDEDPLPFYVNQVSRTFAYWDQGPQARRMPWQTSEYYQAQESSLRDSAFRRLHLNERSSVVDDFIPIEWWDRLEIAIPPLDKTIPVVVGADASVTSDYSALVAVSRDPSDANKTWIRDVAVFEPSEGHPLDYTKTIEPTLRDWCQRYNVVEVAYDQYQLHDMMTRLRNEAVAWCRVFNQHGDRMVADKQLYDNIRDQGIYHYGPRKMRDAVQACGAKSPPDDNTRMRLVKKAQKSKIDPLVAASMANYECRRLNLG